MAKLKPDYIEWVLTLNASDAQKEIHNLSEKNKELRDSNKEIKKAMTDLIATGKAGGKQWKRLDEQLKENNKTIGENNKKIAECEKRLDKTTMSANQLARKANALRKELRDTVKSLQPEKYAALEKELKEVEKAYGQATNSVHIIRDNHQVRIIILHNVDDTFGSLFAKCIAGRVARIGDKQRFDPRIFQLVYIFILILPGM